MQKSKRVFTAVPVDLRPTALLLGDWVETGFQAWSPEKRVLVVERGGG